MATLRRKKAEPFSVFQRDPGPWPPILLNWMATLAIIMVFGLVMLFSASYTTGYLRFGDSFHYIKSQLLCTVLGLGMMFLFSYFDHRFLRRMVKLGYIVCLILLVLVLFSSPINGCRRWISFGGLTLQASEVAKFEMILLTADIAARTPQVRFGELPLRKWVYHSIVVELIRPILWLMPVLILLVLEPHMSGILLTTAIVGTILLLGGSGGIITWGCAGAALFLLETLLKHVDSIDYLQSRLDGWTQDLDRMTSQTKQSLYAIGSGGATGLGLGNSIEKQLWLPESTNDFIFSVVCEELGFVGAVIVIVLFVLFLVQGFWIAFHAENRFCTLVGIGIMAQIAWQVFCNIAVVTNTLPNTGISLPFFSSGGTSLILLLARWALWSISDATANGPVWNGRKPTPSGSASARQRPLCWIPRAERRQNSKEEPRCVYSLQPAALPAISTRLWPLREPSKKPTPPPRSILRAGRRAWSTVWSHRRAIPSITSRSPAFSGS